MSNLTRRPVYQKGQKAKRRNQPTAEDRRHWERARALGCIVGTNGCEGRITIHHCGTGGGGRKDHRMVIPLCFGHHLGEGGIDGKRVSKREWQERHGTETELLKRVEERLCKASN